MRKLTLLNLLLIAVLFAAAAWAWPTLPERIPKHFGASGVPDSWTRTTLWSWFALPSIAAFTVILLEVTGSWLGSRPELLNIPSKKQFLQLPAEEQQPILREMRLLVQGMATLIPVLFGTIQLATYRAAFGGDVRGLMMAVLVLAVAMGPVLAVVMLVRTSTQVTAAHRRSKLRGTLRT